MQIDILKKIIELKKLKKEFSVITNLKNSKNYIFIDQIIHQDLQQYKNEINDAYISRKDGIIKGTELFVKNYHRPIKVVIVGAVHISQFFVEYAKFLNLDMFTRLSKFVNLSETKINISKYLGIKTSNEIKNIESCHIEDGLALIKFIIDLLV